MEKSKRDVVNIVHVGEATLVKRVKEFALTSSSSLTVEEFEDQVKALEAEQKKELQLTTIGAPAPADSKIGCQHLGGWLSETRGWINETDPKLVFKRSFLGLTPRFVVRSVAVAQEEELPLPMTCFIMYICTPWQVSILLLTLCFPAAATALQQTDDVRLLYSGRNGAFCAWHVQGLLRGVSGGHRRHQQWCRPARLHCRHPSRGVLGTLSL